MFPDHISPTELNLLQDDSGAVFITRKSKDIELTPAGAAFPARCRSDPGTGEPLKKEICWRYFVLGGEVRAVDVSIVYRRDRSRIGGVALVVLRRAGVIAQSINCRVNLSANLCVGFKLQAALQYFNG